MKILKTEKWGEEELKCCADCIKEDYFEAVSECSTDWDSYQECDKCDRDNYTSDGGLKIMEIKKYNTTNYEFIDNKGMDDEDLILEDENYNINDLI